METAQKIARNCSSNPADGISLSIQGKWTSMYI